jgi:hypothetical protein
MDVPTRRASAVVALAVPAMLALWFGQYLIENFFPDVTLIDLAAFYAMGLVSGLATGISWALSRTRGRDG